MSCLLKALGFMLVFSGCLSGRVFAQDTEWKNISREIVNGICIHEDPDCAQVIYLGTQKGLYKTDDAGLRWRNILHERDLSVRNIAFDASNPGRIFAATNKGVYSSDDNGASWKNIFRSSDLYESSCRAIVSCLPELYVATDQGLMKSSDAGSHWSKEQGFVKESRITAIAFDRADDGYLYASASNGVYRKRASAGQWEKVFQSRHGRENEEQYDDADASDEYERPQESAIRYLCVDPRQRSDVYIATSAGVFSSPDSGATWEQLTGIGLSSKDIRSVAIGPGSSIYAATSSDVFQYDRQRWHRVAAGITGQPLQSLAAGRSCLYAAGDSGAYCIAHGLPESGGAGADVSPYTEGLPSIASVQRAAIAFADVDIRKIGKWRRQARSSAFLPSFDIGVNKNSGDLWHWEGGSTTKEYDDLLRKGKTTYEWDVGLSWDLGKLIWSDDQTSIDARSRLLVQLRSDILDEVTKLYFEYVRVRMEMDSLTMLDTKKLAQKEVRLRELAAQLDGLTDNFFSRH